jgi:hypothetical protein
LKRDHVVPDAVLQGDLTLVADAHEAPPLVQRQRRLIDRGDPRDHRPVALLGRLRQQVVEHAGTEAFAPPAVLHVHGVLHRARVRRLGAIGRQRSERHDLAPVHGHDHRIDGAVGGQPRRLGLGAARLGVGGRRRLQHLAVPDGGDGRVIARRRRPDHDG